MKSLRILVTVLGYIAIGGTMLLLIMSFLISIMYNIIEGLKALFH